MAASVTITSQEKVGRELNVRGTVALSSSYTSGGQALTFNPVKSSRKTPLQIRFESIVGYNFEYDYTNNKLLIRQAPAQTHAHDLKVIGSQAAASTDAVSAKVDTLGKESASNITALGADSDTKGGVISATLAAAPYSEIPASTYPAALSGTPLRFSAVFNFP